MNGTSIAVIGMVSKVGLNIMDRNWVHLVDEAGRELIATSSDIATPGSILVARGQLVAGKTFKTGYYTPLLLEDASLSDGS